VTVTHPEIIRYFMTIPEAARLVLQAGAIGESGQVLVLDMGEPVKIVDLAKQLIRLSGHSADEIEVEFSGLRPGEKLYEELLADSDTTVATRFRQLRVARLDVQTHSAEALLQLARPEGAAIEGDVVREALAVTVPEYQFNRTSANRTPAN
jgi:FlaA1/EpsC-like NDP-sugar epimerase